MQRACFIEGIFGRAAEHTERPLYHAAVLISSISHLYCAPTQASPASAIKMQPHKLLMGIMMKPHVNAQHGTSSMTLSSITGTSAPKNAGKVLPVRAWHHPHALAWKPVKSREASRSGGEETFKERRRAHAGTRISKGLIASHQRAAITSGLMSKRPMMVRGGQVHRGAFMGTSQAIGKSVQGALMATIQP